MRGLEERRIGMRKGVEVEWKGEKEEGRMRGRIRVRARG